MTRSWRAAGCVCVCVCVCVCMSQNSVQANKNTVRTCTLFHNKTRLTTDRDHDHTHRSRECVCVCALQLERLMPCVCSSLPDLPGPDMSFIFDWIYSGFSSVLQFLGEFISVCVCACVRRLGRVTLQIYSFTVTNYLKVFTNIIQLPQYERNVI